MERQKDHGKHRFFSYQTQVQYTDKKGSLLSTNGNPIEKASLGRQPYADDMEDPRLLGGSRGYARKKKKETEADSEVLVRSSRSMFKPPYKKAVSFAGGLRARSFEHVSALQKLQLLELPYTNSTLYHTI